MEEKGTVLEVHGNMAKIQIESKEVCRGCQLCSLGSGKSKIFQVENLVGAKKGDSVVIEVPSTDLLKGAFILYLLPAILFISGFLLGSKISSFIGFERVEEGVSIITGVTFLFLALFFASYSYRRWIEKGKRFKPRIIFSVKR